LLDRRKQIQSAGEFHFYQDFVTNIGGGATAIMAQLVRQTANGGNSI
jgi:hypothetical protein